MAEPRVGDDDVPMSNDERKAVLALERLAKQWPRTLMLASMAGSLHVMRLRGSGDHPMLEPAGFGGMDPDAVVATIQGIPNTGGDW